MAFDLAVLDEAHKTVGVASKTFATLLRDDAITIRRRLFMTATERVLRARTTTCSRWMTRQYMESGFSNSPLKTPSRSEIISDYRILTITVSDEHIREIIRKTGCSTSAPMM